MSSRAVLLLSLLAVVACSSASEPEDIGHNAAALDTYPNEQPAFDYFLSKGLSPAQSAGIVGNLDVESGVDPSVVEEGGGPGRGIAQWSTGARWDTTEGDNVEDYATQQGESADSLHLQLEFVWFELTTFPDYGLGKLKTETDITSATTTFANDFEGCGTCNTTTRVAHAQSVFDRFSADSPDGSASSSAGGPTGPACALTDGTAGICISTSDCSGLGNHLSTAGLCAGAADIQCCTPTATSSTSSSGGSSGTSTSSTSSSGGDLSSNHAASQDDSGCAAAGTRSTGPGPSVWLAGLALAFVLRKRRSRA